MVCCTWKILVDSRLSLCRELQHWMCPPAMAATASPLPPSTKVASSENSSSFYDYEYFLGDVAFMLCRKDEVLSFGRVFLPLFYGLIFVLGLSGNLLLLVVLLRYVPRRRMTEIYLLNLAISNLLFLVTLPFWGISVAWHWVFGSFLCKVVSTLYTINFYSGIFFISCMSLDKYLEIVCAQPHHRLRTRAKSLLLAAAVWAVALAVSIPDMVFVRTQENAPGVWDCFADFGGHGTIWKLFLRFQQNLLGFLLPLLAMIFFYSRIGSVLARLRPPGQSRALRMAIGLVVAFFVLWFPYNVTLFLHSLLDLQVFGDCKVSQHLDYALQVTESIAFLHCCFTPVLYAFSSRRFRQYLKAFLATVLRRHQAPYLAQAPPSSYSESSRLSGQEDITGMNDLGERQAEDSPNKGDTRKNSA
ncbi:atypical chemokine receptor 2 isoform X1 [Orcinus orca]|uniref:atypical chemokine receptor 2 isoform X1 n=2 Tax=Orcinus orca TaxID=9733 RepID=UPI0014410258|nr:atypical chemokine receptor 2 isoform X1 [Orcinus orca]XP_033257929.1 atypical chemokine receptor 2 isoform X1 [Orcinus orca]XP_049549611.1 atypical chemokine receptor 2 isoform X1 [Orcinus orca]XP_049549613.1 atypical chemokine receptor 2 isoform X1 [Orcinus orca]XP_049549614.1 atypical chemokine receptor 2 isoform X1 [Orcinus orca]